MTANWNTAPLIDLVCIVFSSVDTAFVANQHLFAASEGKRQGQRSVVPESLQGVERNCTVSTYVHFAHLESTADLLPGCRIARANCTERVNSIAETDCQTQQILLKARRRVAANEKVEGQKMPTKGKYPTSWRGRPRNTKKQTLDPHIQTVGNQIPRSLQPVSEWSLDPLLIMDPHSRAPKILDLGTDFLIDNMVFVSDV